MDAEGLTRNMPSDRTMYLGWAFEDSRERPRLGPVSKEKFPALLYLLYLYVEQLSRNRKTTNTQNADEMIL